MPKTRRHNVTPSPRRAGNPLAGRSSTGAKTQRKATKMKTITCSFVVALTALGCLTLQAANWTQGMTEGKPEFKSISQLAFGPEGILIVADAKAAAITAIATGDTAPAKDTKSLKVEGVNQKIAGLLGTSADQILINDMVVNPISRNAYLAVSH